VAPNPAILATPHHFHSPASRAKCLKRRCLAIVRALANRDRAIDAALGQPPRQFATAWLRLSGSRDQGYMMWVSWG
jgi:hypothetical protein